MNIEIYTDGACSGNPGPGGFAAILVCGGHEKVISGYESRTTNNRMETRPILDSLQCLKKPCNITLYSDSTHAINNMANLDEIERRGWKTKTGAKIANFDLWQAIQVAKKSGGHTVACVHTKGHSGDKYNERCDSIAKEEIRRHA